MKKKQLYKHQQRFIDKNPDRALLVWEGGTGKTLAACEWLKLRADKKALVLVPKPIIKKWERDLKESGAVADVASHDSIKKMDLNEYKILVVDEAHGFSAPLFSKQRSQRATKLYQYVKEHQNAHVLLLTATPIRSTPWNIHSLACYVGRFWPVKAFRDEFEYMTDMYGRWHYELKPSWRKQVRRYVEEISDIVLMSHCTDIPKQETQIIEVPWSKDQETALSASYLEPSAAWHERHRAEQGEPKLAALRALTDQYRKSIVVCNYTAQIDHYAKELGKDRAVFVLQGKTKDQDAVITAAREADDCIFIVQASMSQGWDASEFSVMIFASMSYKYIDYVQAKWRITRMNNLHENLYVHLIAGKCDKAVHDTIMKGQDFDVHVYLRNV